MARACSGPGSSRGAPSRSAARAGCRSSPPEALAYAVGISKVFVVADGRAQERLVKAGLREAGWVEILDGVKPGETVATSGLAQLYDGAPVAPVASTPGPAAGPAARP
jgi:membrane fusion protein, multidrug efflux system